MRKPKNLFQRKKKTKKETKKLKNLLINLLIMIKYIININAKTIHHMILKKPEIKAILIMIVKKKIIINMDLLTTNLNLK